MRENEKTAIQEDEDEEDKKLRRQLRIIKEECGVNEINKWGNILVIATIICTIIGVSIFAAHIYWRNQESKKYMQIFKQEIEHKKTISSCPKSVSICEPYQTSIIRLK